MGKRSIGQGFFLGYKYKSQTFLLSLSGHLRASAAEVLNYLVKLTKVIQLPSHSLKKTIKLPFLCNHDTEGTLSLRDGVTE